jgi:ABC-type multidrug transport system permease subunit
MKSSPSLTLKHIVAFILASVTGFIAGVEVSPRIGVFTFFVTIPIFFHLLQWGRKQIQGK